MTSKTITIASAEGLHARPASELVKAVKGSGCEVTLATASRTVRADSMMAILSLGLKCGTDVTLSVNGDNETEVLEKLAGIIIG